MAYGLKFFKYFFRMGSFPKFCCQILPCPMLVMLAIFPQFGLGDIVNDSFEGYPYFWFILTIPQRELLPGVTIHQ